MKIATYHKNRGDYVEFYKGEAPFHKIQSANRVYITTLFTFHYDLTVKTINHYRKFIDDRRIYVGGIAATIMPEKFKEDVGNVVLQLGQRTSSTDLGYSDDINIDALPLDYDILDDVIYEYPAANNFFAYATRGCKRGCKFCAVPKLEPEFKNVCDLKNQIEKTREKYGDKRNILLMDNNVLYSDRLKTIAKGLNELGFVKDEATYSPPNPFEILMGKIRRRVETENDTHMVCRSAVDHLQRRVKNILKEETKIEMKGILEEIDGMNTIDILEKNYERIIEITDIYRNKKKLQRFIDFNQGIDARILTNTRMEALSNLPLKPFRLAYDNMKITERYQQAFRTAYKHGVRHFSNYMLYNYDDKPEELWERLNNNVQLCKELPEAKLFSFPMKYAPIDKTDRKCVGEHWTRKELNAMNVILNVTKGVVMKEEDFFSRAYGHTSGEFLKILAMPDEFIKYRTHFDNNGLNDAWGREYDALSSAERRRLLKILSKEDNIVPVHLENILKFYKMTREKTEHVIVDSSVDLKNVVAAAFASPAKL